MKSPLKDLVHIALLYINMLAKEQKKKPLIPFQPFLLSILSQKEEDKWSKVPHWSVSD